MTIRLKPLLINIFIPLAVGGFSALLTMNSMESFENINQPPLSPPGWLFPVVWTILYILMGISAYIVVTSSATDKQKRNARHRARWQAAFQPCASDGGCPAHKYAV